MSDSITITWAKNPRNKDCWDYASCRYIDDTEKLLGRGWEPFSVEQPKLLLRRRVSEREKGDG